MWVGRWPTFSIHPTPLLLQLLSLEFFTSNNLSRRLLRCWSCWITTSTPWTVTKCQSKNHILLVPLAAHRLEAMDRILSNQNSWWTRNQKHSIRKTPAVLWPRLESRGRLLPKLWPPHRHSTVCMGKSYRYKIWERLGRIFWMLYRVNLPKIHHVPPPPHRCRRRVYRRVMAFLRFCASGVCSSGHAPESDTGSRKRQKTRRWLSIFVIKSNHNRETCGAGWWVPFRKAVFVIPLPSHTAAARVL